MDFLWLTLLLGPLLSSRTRGGGQCASRNLGELQSWWTDLSVPGASRTQCRLPKFWAGTQRPKSLTCSAMYSEPSYPNNPIMQDIEAWNMLPCTDRRWLQLRTRSKNEQYTFVYVLLATSFKRKVGPAYRMARKG